ncbi:MAG: adenylate/guanylate cyclase domain-containing protein [Candidatus Helarchaeota archaeon]|nr:adenylate/guanylate cyclase domain-containing protein [Candidatus Helarchaeota archaeon]
MELWNFLDDTLNDEKEKIDLIVIQDLERIPLESDMSLEVGRWHRIRNVVSLYIDMKGSTQLTNEQYIKTSAKMYQIFTGSLIKILREFEAQFIDIKGDGGFALWKERFGSVKALLAGVTFKTLVEKHLKTFVKNQITDWIISSKVGIAKGDVLVKRVGTRNTTDQKYNWAVWAGKPVNISVKLSDKSNGDTVLVTDNVFQDLSNPKGLYNYLILSCGCDGKGNYVGKKNLWTEKSELESEFQTRIWELRSKWCDTHGEEYLNTSLEIIKTSK